MGYRKLAPTTEGDTAAAVVGYRTYSTARGDMMLDIYVNSERRYRLGPFDNKVQRQILVDNLRRMVDRLGGGHMRMT